MPAATTASAPAIASRWFALEFSPVITVLDSASHRGLDEGTARSWVLGTSGRYGGARLAPPRDKLFGQHEHFKNQTSFGGDGRPGIVPCQFLISKARAESSVRQAGHGQRRKRARANQRPIARLPESAIERPSDRQQHFAPAESAGTLLGRVEGLNPGANQLEVSDGHGTQKIGLINHPIGGPVFSGPHQQPFICQTEFSGLEKAVDADCNAPTQVQYFYRSTETIDPGRSEKAVAARRIGAWILASETPRRNCRPTSPRLPPPTANK